MMDTIAATFPRRAALTLFAVAWLIATPAVDARPATESHADLPAEPNTALTPDSAALERGRRLTRWLLDGRPDSVFESMAPAYAESLGGSAGVAQAVEQIRTGVGAEQERVAEAVSTRLDTDHYYRISRFSGVPGRTVTIHWAWNHDGAVTRVLARPTPQPASTGTEDHSTKTDLTLPFAGQWYVFWGGRRADQNYHVTAPTQRFAYDFVVVREGSTHQGRGTENDDYLCFGRPVLAPAPGTVSVAVDTLPDNRPGQMNREAPAGNHVVIDHGNDEYSLLAHFRSGSIRVEPGDSVRRGQTLGACGNSGNSSEPHVHYHLQTGPSFGEGVGLPARFRDYQVDGATVRRGEPVRGALVTPSPRSP